MKDLIIIGAGPAGLSACLYATRAGARGVDAGCWSTWRKVECQC